MIVRKQESVIFSIDELGGLQLDLEERELLKEILMWSSEALMDDSGNRIVVFLLRASGDIVIEVIPANSDASVEQCRQILSEAVRGGLFNPLLTTLKVYKRLRPVILYFAERFAKLESMNMSLSLSHGKFAGGDGYAN